jgi:hypothetical protein
MYSSFLYKIIILKVSRNPYAKKIKKMTLTNISKCAKIAHSVWVLLMSLSSTCHSKYTANIAAPSQPKFETVQGFSLGYEAFRHISNSIAITPKSKALPAPPYI